MTSPASLHSSSSTEHYTPPEIIEAAREMLGGIGLDPASSAIANGVVKAERYYTQDDNGFTKPWGSRAYRSTVLLNPPGGKCDVDGVTCIKPSKGAPYVRATNGNPPHSLLSAQKTWWYKLADEYEAGRVYSAIFVCFSIELLQNAQVKRPPGLLPPTRYPICYPSRRLSYYQVGPEGELVRGGSPPHASCIIYLPRPLNLGPPEGEWYYQNRFAEVFGRIGEVVIPR